MGAVLLPNAHLPHSNPARRRQGRGPRVPPRGTGLVPLQGSPLPGGQRPQLEGMGLSPVVSHAWARGRGDALPAGRLCPPRGHLFRARGGNSRPHWPRWKAPRGSDANGPVREGRAPAGGGRAKRRPGGIENGTAEPGSAGRGPGPGRGPWRRRYSPPPSTPTTSPPNCGGW